MSRDFIGENLLDIENTLKALNLDFLNAFNELEKTDSAETLFGENNYPYDSNVNPKLRNSALKLSKLTHSYNLVNKLDFSSPKSVKSMPYSPSEIKQQQHQHNFTNQFFTADASDKMEDKRSSTPDTGFASRETNVSSRRGSQKSSYSPQESSHFSPREFTYPEQTAAPSAAAAAAAVRAAYMNELSVARKLSSSPVRTVHSSINSIHSMIHTTAAHNRRVVAPENNGFVLHC